MTEKLSHFSKIIFTFIIFIACNANDKRSLIIGTWTPLNPSAINAPEMHISFLTDGIGVAAEKGKEPASIDTISYTIKNNGELLVVKERSGNIEEMRIIELTDKALTLISRKRGDTIRLIRE